MAVNATGRRDTRLEANGAEFLVLGNLLIEGISAYKNYVNMPGYDLVAVNPGTKRMARIQVKSRYVTLPSSFLIKNFDSDFAVFVALNRGYRRPKKGSDDPEGIKQPDFYVFPTKKIKKLSKPGSRFGKIPVKSIPKFEQYQGRWDLIRDFLVGKSK